jgi:hypothetical protein
MAFCAVRRLGLTGWAKGFVGRIEAASDRFDNDNELCYQIADRAYSSNLFPCAKR